MSEKKDPVITREDPLIFHFRIWDGSSVCSRGGVTVVFDPKVKRFGVAVCSLKDGFSKKLGRLIATGRANSKGAFYPADIEGPVTIGDIRFRADELARAATFSRRSPSGLS